MFLLLGSGESPDKVSCLGLLGLTSNIMFNCNLNWLQNLENGIPFIIAGKRLRARDDHYASSTLIGRKGGARGPSSLASHYA